MKKIIGGLAAAALSLGLFQASPAEASAAGPPSAPTMNPPVVYRSDAVQVKWGFAPSHGTPVTGYIVAHDGVNATSVSVSASTRAYGFAQLTAGRTYHFTVTATSAAGNSPSGTTTVTLAPSNVPGAPVIQTPIVYNNAAIQIKWGYAPSNGSAVSSYLVSRDTVCQSDTCEECDGNDNFPGPPCDGGIQSFTVSGSSRAYSFPGLWAGHAYHFTVQAVNSFGTGPGASISATPVVAPLSIRFPASISFTQLVYKDASACPGGCIVGIQDVHASATVTCPAGSSAGSGPDGDSLYQDGSELLVYGSVTCTGGSQEVQLGIGSESVPPFVDGAEASIHTLWHGAYSGSDPHYGYQYFLSGAGEVLVHVTTVYTTN